MGLLALQVLRYYGYVNLGATASGRNFELVRACGARLVFDYASEGVKGRIKEGLGDVGLVFDCVGSLEGSVRPISRIVGKGTTVAVLLPVIVKAASETEKPEYEMDVEKVVKWADGVIVKGVRTHFYLEVSQAEGSVQRSLMVDSKNEFHATHLQSEIMPAMLAEGLIKPGRQKVVEGPTMLARAQKAIDMLRRGDVSGERLVWRVAET